MKIDKISNFDNIFDAINYFCTDEWKEIIRVNEVVAEYPPGVKIFEQNSEINFIQIVEKGRVKIISEINDGVRILRLASDGMIIGHRGLGEDSKYSVSAVTLESTKIKSIPLKIFVNVLKANSHFCFHMLMFFADELKRSEKLSKIISSTQVLNRVAKAIKMNIDAFGYENKKSKKLAFTISRKEISQIAATTYESVVRTLAELNDAKIIKIDGKQIHVVKEKKLLELIARQ